MKFFAKRMTLIAAYLAISPLLLLYWLGMMVFSKDDIITAFSQLLSLVPGKSGSYIRKAFYSATLEACSSDTFIGFGTLISQHAVTIGPGVYIGPQCNVGQCAIGEQTLLGSAVHILSGRHQHSSDEHTHTPNTQENKYQTVKVGKYCWIGNGAIIMADVGDHSVIGAGSVVVKPIPANSVAVGNPAKVVKQNVGVLSTSSG